MIYVLALEDDCYYVGYTTTRDRVDHHLQGGASAWTRLHKPIAIVETRFGAKSLEKEVTLEYMRKYGWERVRGAAWTACNLRAPLEFRVVTDHPQEETQQ